MVYSLHCLVFNNVLQGQIRIRTIFDPTRMYMDKLLTVDKESTQYTRKCNM